MLYRLYNGDGNLVMEEYDVNGALETFGKDYDHVTELYGKEYADTYSIKVFIDKGKGNKIKFAEYSILEFLHKEPVLADFQIKGSNKEVYDHNDDFMAFRERARNFDEVEQKEALKYIPTGYILGELTRRFEEYNNAKAGIASIIENMKIFNKE